MYFSKTSSDWSIPESGILPPGHKPTKNKTKARLCAKAVDDGEVPAENRKQRVASMRGRGEASEASLVTCDEGKTAEFAKCAL